MLSVDPTGAARSGDPPDNDALQENAPESLRAVLALIVRHRIALFIVVGVVFIAAFNGQWRISRDSAAYRGIARNLVRTHQYVFRPKLALLGGDKQDTMYPGFPLILAGLNVAGFGESTAAALVLMNLMALAALVLVYKLCRLLTPPWLAIAVTAGVGINRIFLENANELLSDMPFFLGLVMSLYGYEKIHRAKNGRACAWALAIIVPGLMLSASTRPTFWILAAAWTGASIWGLIINGRWQQIPFAIAVLLAIVATALLPAGLKLSFFRVGARAFIWISVSVGGIKVFRPAQNRYAIALAALVALVVIGLALDPRTHGFHPLSGGYEARAVSQLSDLPALFKDIFKNRLPKLMEIHLPLAFFGTPMDTNLRPLRAIMWLYSLMLIASGVWLLRRNVLWGLFVLISIGTLALLGDVPRYYLMLIPMLLTGWGLFCYEIARRMTWWKNLPAIAMIYGLAIVAVPNLIRCLDLAREQHGFDHKLRHKSFVEVYDDGKRAALVGVAEMVRRSARPEQKILGPDPSIVSYLSDRNVYGIGHLVSRRGRDWLTQISAMDFDLVVLPPRRHTEIYDDKDRLTGELIDAGYFSPTKELDHDPDGFRLSEFKLVTVRARHQRSRRTAPAARTRAATAPAGH